MLSGNSIKHFSRRSWSERIGWRSIARVIVDTSRSGMNYYDTPNWHCFRRIRREFFFLFVFGICRKKKSHNKVGSFENVADLRQSHKCDVRNVFFGRFHWERLLHRFGRSRHRQMAPFNNALMIVQARERANIRCENSRIKWLSKTWLRARRLMALMKRNFLKPFDLGAMKWETRGLHVEIRELRVNTKTVGWYLRGISLGIFTVTDIWMPRLISWTFKYQAKATFYDVLRVINYQWS